MSTTPTHHQIEVNGFRMHYVRAGQGDPLVLLHGWPQSWYEWHRVLPGLAERFDVIVPDLRGLGDSERPESGYDKRTLASDIAELVTGLGFERVGVVGHDWGGAVGYHLAHDRPDLVDRLLVFDMVPGIVRAGDPIPVEIGLRANHAFFHGGNPDWAAALVSHDIEGYLRRFLTATDFNYAPDVFGEAEIAEYVRVNSAPGALRAGFEYYATALREDAVALAENTDPLTQPVRVWFGEVFLGSMFDPVALWRQYATDVTGGIIERCGHFVPDERPDVVLAQTLDFFAAPSTPAAVAAGALTPGE